MEDLEQKDSSIDLNKSSKRRSRDNKRKRVTQKEEDEEWKGKVGSTNPNHRRYTGYGTRSSTRNAVISSTKVKPDEVPSTSTGETKTCPKCKRMFRMWIIEDHQKWKWHISVNHSYPCPVPSCNLLFHHYKSLATHKRTHTKDELAEGSPLSMYHNRESDDDPMHILRTRLVKPQPLPPDVIPSKIAKDTKDLYNGTQDFSTDSFCQGSTDDNIPHSYTPLLSNSYFRIDKSVPSTPTRVIPPAVLEKIKVRNQLGFCLQSNQFMPLVRRGLIPNGFHPHTNGLYQPAKLPDHLDISPVDGQVVKRALPTYSLMSNVFPSQRLERDFDFTRQRERFISQPSDINFPLHPPLLSRGVPGKIQQFCTQRQYPSTYLRKAVELPGRPYRRPQSSKQHSLSPLARKHSMSGVSYMFPSVSDMNDQSHHQDLYKAQDKDTPLSLLRLTSKKRFLKRGPPAGLGRNSVKPSSLPNEIVS